MTDHTPDDELDDVNEENEVLDEDYDEEIELDDEGYDDDDEGDDEDDEGSEPALKPVIIKGGTVPEDETIGSLHFVANPEFPYPLNIPKPPRFWMEEQTGVLNDAVESYMRGDALKPPQMAAIKTYLTQFLERAPLTGDANVGVLLRKLERVRSSRDLENFADEAAEFGAEVF